MNMNWDLERIYPSLDSQNFKDDFNKLNKQIENIFDISKETDTILRRSLNKILQDDNLLNIFDSKSENVEKYFEKLIFN